MARTFLFNYYGILVVYFNIQYTGIHFKSCTMAAIVAVLLSPAKFSTLSVLRVTDFASKAFSDTGVTPHPFNY